MELGTGAGYITEVDPGLVREGAYVNIKGICGKIIVSYNIVMRGDVEVAGSMEVLGKVTTSYRQFK